MCPRNRIKPTPGGELATAFWLFHHTVEEVRSKRVVGDSPLTSLSFSDSAFFITPQPADALQLALDLIRTCIERHLPVRVGVGYGWFAPVKYAQEWTARQPTFTAQFIGTGLVGAHDSAECPAKGLRVFINPSFEPYFAGLARFRWLELPDDEKSAAARFELNYLWGDPQKDLLVTNAVAQMRLNAAGKAPHHYDATEKALTRMSATIASVTP